MYQGYVQDNGAVQLIRLRLDVQGIGKSKLGT